AYFNTKADWVKSGKIPGVIAVTSEHQLAGGTRPESAGIKESDRDVVITRSKPPLGTLASERYKRLRCEMVVVVANIIRQHQACRADRQAPVARVPAALGIRRCSKCYQSAERDDPNSKFTHHAHPVPNRKSGLSGDRFESLTIMDG